MIPAAKYKWTSSIKHLGDAAVMNQEWVLWKRQLLSKSGMAFGTHCWYPPENTWSSKCCSPKFSIIPSCPGTDRFGSVNNDELVRPPHRREHRIPNQTNKKRPMPYWTNYTDDQAEIISIFLDPSRDKKQLMPISHKTTTSPRCRPNYLGQPHHIMMNGKYFWPSPVNWYQQVRLANVWAHIGPCALMGPCDRMAGSRFGCLAVVVVVMGGPTSMRLHALSLDSVSKWLWRRVSDDGSVLRPAGLALHPRRTWKGLGRNAHNDHYQHQPSKHLLKFQLCFVCESFQKSATLPSQLNYSPKSMNLIEGHWFDQVPFF